MRIGGLQKCSLIDYPGKVACVIFTQGCNFRCPYCHNRELVLPKYFGDTIPQDDVINFLERRQHYLEGVVITGGEPTYQADLLDLLKQIKQMGYSLKLDTNGSCPDVLQEIIACGLVDYIAMDVKTSFEKYSKATGVRLSVERIKESIALIRGANVKYEFRTTVVRPFCEFEDIHKIVVELGGKQAYKLQPFKATEKIINPNIHSIDQFNEHEIESWKVKI